jgi:serine-type D-Ala-D-Ala carboxypeptidase/endopeptidase
VHGDHSLVRGYGETEKGNGRTPDGNSLLRLNSVTKVFTTEVLASLAAEGKRPGWRGLTDGPPQCPPQA